MINNLGASGLGRFYPGPPSRWRGPAAWQWTWDTAELTFRPRLWAFMWFLWGLDINPSSISMSSAGRTAHLACCVSKRQQKLLEGRAGGGNISCLTVWREGLQVGEREKQYFRSTLHWGNLDIWLMIGKKSDITEEKQHLKGSFAEGMGGEKCWTDKSISNSNWSSR